MQEQIDQYTAEINAFSPANADELETFRIKFLGTKGIIKDLFDQFKNVGPEEKRTFGKVLNQFKQLAEAKYNELKESFRLRTRNSNPKSILLFPAMVSTSARVIRYHWCGTRSSIFLNAWASLWPKGRR